jgi:response regulator RpfG family c-di-GMP phosphodiesterase
MADTAHDRPRVLVVDDDRAIREMLAEFLDMEGYAVRAAEDGVAAVSELAQKDFDIIISDLKMPRMGGIALLEEIGRQAPSAVTVIMTGFGTVETAIDAMKRGAYDYLLKPFKMDEVVRVLKRGLDKRRMAAENLRLREAVSLYKVSEAIAASLSLEQVLETLSDSCIQEIRADLASTWLDNGEGGLSERLQVRGPNVQAELTLGTLNEGAIEARLRSEGQLLEQGAAGMRFFAEEPQSPLISFMAVPLKMQKRSSGKESLGFVALSSFSPNHRFDEGQRKMLSIVASRAAAAIENAKLYEDLQGTFQQTIEGLAKAIDKMDQYTAGHSDRVATYAVVLAQSIGLGPEEIEIVRQSALMHDIGKIGCVLNLNKPGKLTVDEYEAFKKHPLYGKDILEPIKFLHPLIPGVHLHHERWDGRGYPLGLAANDIPIIARIISIADTYDAMTSDRSYRRALPHAVALAEIKRCSGSQFDPDAARDFFAAMAEFREAEAASGKKVLG